MIKQLTVGMMQEQVYFFIDDKTKHGFIIDPGAEAKRILSVVQKEGFVIEKILITHGHFDHIGAAAQLQEAIQCPIIIHKEGKKYLEDPDWNLSRAFGEGFTLKADSYVEHGDIVSLSTNSDMNLKVIYAPGHTADGVAYYTAKYQAAFVGDIIFKDSVGRSDFPGGNANRLLSSIRAQIFTLPEDTVLYTGHGEKTTVGYEKMMNPNFNLFD